jgi:hypothetical protein
MQNPGSRAAAALRRHLPLLAILTAAGCACPQFPDDFHNPPHPLPLARVAEVLRSGPQLCAAVCQAAVSAGTIEACTVTEADDAVLECRVTGDVLGDDTTHTIRKPLRDEIAVLPVDLAERIAAQLADECNVCHGGSAYAQLKGVGLKSHEIGVSCTIDVLQLMVKCYYSNQCRS